MTETFNYNTVHRISKYCEKFDNIMVKKRNKVSQILRNNKTKLESSLRLKKIKHYDCSKGIFRK